MGQEKIKALRSLCALWLLPVIVFVACVLSNTSAFAQTTHLLVITGVPGDEEHAKQFAKWADAFVDAAKKKDAVADGNITVLADRAATKEGVEKAFADLSARVRPSDAVVVLLIGHGSFNGTQAAFNLPGPDLTAQDWAKLLGKLPSLRVAFVNTSSASGAFLPTVAAPGRVVITATKTGGERNETVFPEYFVAAFADPSADRDRNGHVSLAEAFEYAKAKVVQAFQQKGLLLTEHATLDDSGEGQLAAQMYLGIRHERSGGEEAGGREGRHRSADRRAQAAEERHAGGAVRRADGEAAHRAGAQDEGDSRSAGEEGEA